MSNPDPRNAPLEEGVYYHIYNRGNGGENVFREKRNYEYFMRLYAQHLEPFVETFAYCLLKNHFHLLVRIKDVTGFQKPVTSRPIDATQAFSNWFNAYAKAYNKAYARNGSLFQRPFRRVPVVTEGHLYNVVRYIHRNPQKHGFVADFREWEFSSFHEFTDVTGFQNPVTSAVTSANKVLEWFGGLQPFLDFHHDAQDERAVQGIIGEDPD